MQWIRFASFVQRLHFHFASLTSLKCSPRPRPWNMASIYDPQHMARGIFLHMRREKACFRRFPTSLIHSQTSIDASVWMKYFSKNSHSNEYVFFSSFSCVCVLVVVLCATGTLRSACFASPFRVTSFGNKFLFFINACDYVYRVFSTKKTFVKIITKISPVLVRNCSKKLHNVQT